MNNNKRGDANLPTSSEIAFGLLVLLGAAVGAGDVWVRVGTRHENPEGLELVMLCTASGTGGKEFHTAPAQAAAEGRCNPLVGGKKSRHSACRGYAVVGTVAERDGTI